MTDYENIKDDYTEALRLYKMIDEVRKSVDLGAFLNDNVLEEELEGVSSLVLDKLINKIGHLALELSYWNGEKE